jgi:hypothetical protein
MSDLLVIAKQTLTARSVQRSRLPFRAAASPDTNREFVLVLALLADDNPCATEERNSKLDWPRVMRNAPRGAGRNVDRGACRPAVDSYVEFLLSQTLTIPPSSRRRR